MFGNEQQTEKSTLFSDMKKHRKNRYFKNVENYQKKPKKTRFFEKIRGVRF